MVIFLIANTLYMPEGAIRAAKNALSLCANVLIPSLLPFFIFSSILIKLGLANLISRPMSRIMRPLFGVSGAGALCFVLGIVSGYPMGALCVCDMYEQGSISKRDGEKLLAFCNNSGPLFVIGSIGSAMYFNRDIGVVMYLIHIFSTVLVGIIVGLWGRKKEHKIMDKAIISCSKPIGVIIKEAVVGSVNNMLTVCAFTVIFALAINSVSTPSRGGIFELVLGGFLEISSGVYAVSESALSLVAKLALTSAIIGFAGVGVHLQIAAITSKTDLSMKTYFIGKLLHALIASVFAWVVFSNFSVKTSAIYQYPVMPYEVIDFFSALKIAFVYILSTLLVVLVLWLAQKICAWQEEVKYGHGDS